MSYYTDGIVIADAKNPEIIVKVGNYDTYPQGSGPDFNGCWEVYPYFPLVILSVVIFQMV